MAKFVEYLWGWQVTTPDAVSQAYWNQVKEVYVDDKYRQGLKDFFAAHNPWAYQSMTARMLEAVRKGYWQPTEQVQQQLAREYIDNVLRQGVACCDHTCNNPALNQMVINIASLPGVMDPRLVEQFKIAIEKMAQSSLDQQLEQRRQLQRKLQAGFEARKTTQANEQQAQQQKTQAAKSEGREEQQVTGYKMDKVSREDETTELSSSGIQWLAAFSVMVVLAVVAAAIWWRRRQQR